jgi:hypothetical protein
MRSLATTSRAACAVEGIACTDRFFAVAAERRPQTFAIGTSAPTVVARDVDAQPLGETLQ